jgi:antitoxin VapB
MSCFDDGGIVAEAGRCRGSSSFLQSKEDGTPPSNGASARLDFSDRNADNLGRERKAGMSIVIEDAAVESLARELAKSKGVSVADVVRGSLFSLAQKRGVAIRTAPLRERLAALAGEVDALPKRDLFNTRSDDEILGYN